MKLFTHHSVEYPDFPLGLHSVFTPFCFR